MAKQKSRFPSYGLVRGPSHAQGGVAGVVAGKQPVELEGGEWVVPKEVVPDYLPQLVQMTNEGRAMQGMDNGNSAMDALIASASMQNGITEPQSPMYKRGGHMCKKCNKYQEGGLAQECVGGECVVPTIDNQSGLFSMPWKGQDIQIDLMSGMGDREASQYLASDKAGEYFMMPSSDIPADSLKAWYSQMEGLPMPSIPQQQGGPIYSYQGGGGVPEDFLASLKDKEGSLNLIYKDSLGKPTGGIGHLMTDSELKDYGVAKYIDHATIYGPRKVAVDAKGDIIQLDEGVTEDWVKNDSEKAYNAARAQAEELGINNQKMINALGSVNFQLGTGWRKEGKFPGVWEAMKAGKYGRAADNVKWVNPDKQSKGISKWYEDTPERAEDFMEALRGYNKRGGGPIYGYQKGGPVDYSRTAGLYNRFLAQGDSPDMMRTQDILKWRALQNAESSSPEMYDAQSEVGRQFGKDALLTQALLSSVGMEGASAKDKYDLVKALSPAGKQVYYSQYFDNKRAGGPIDYYQTGGQALPRAQKEVRRSIDPGFSVSPRYGQNPITGGPMRPVEMPTLPSVNLDPGFYMKDDQTGMDSLLKQPFFCQNKQKLFLQLQKICWFCQIVL